MDQKTIETYDLLAERYDQETINFWDKFPRTFLDRFVREAKGRVLDIGSGPGRDGLLLKKAGLNIVCLDASDTMIELSKKRGLESVKGDFSNLPFKNDSFEAAWAYTSLLHIPKSEIKKSLSEIRRVLSLGGILGLGMMEGTEEKYREYSDTKLTRWFSFYSKEELESLLISCGFTVTYFEEFRPDPKNPLNKPKNYLNFIARKI